MNIESNVSLRQYNSFGLDAHAQLLARITSVEMLQVVLATHPDTPKYVLGGGSNCLFVEDLVSGLMLKNEIIGKEVIETQDDYTIIKVGGGENWHELVLWCVAQGLGGIENLSLIPGTVGAAPIQNIGAYGVELKDVFEGLEAVDLSTGAIQSFSHADCHFGYRSSIFKSELKGKLFITQVSLRLRHREHRLNTSYGAINSYLEKQEVSDVTIASISEAVIAIRRSKLPDPQEIGNAGSFFKNPEIPRSQFEILQKKFPSIVHYPGSNDLIKVPAGWLIEQCGWKGKRIGEVGCYVNQALVIVNYGKATGQDIRLHAERVQQSVADKFGIVITPEVNIIGE